jgi:signal transduction histidine kinase
MNSNLTIPENEYERVLKLTEFNLDYTNFLDNFKDLAKLAASVAGTAISLVKKLFVLKDNEMDMQSFKEKLIKLYLPQARAKNIQFEVNILPSSLDTPFPRNKLLQIAGNLISNAIKFSPNGGKVNVSLDMEVIGSVNNLIMRVQDSGEGLSPDKIESIMDGEASTENGTEGEKGYGFGLRLIKHLVSSLNGKLKISSVPGEGSIFEVTIDGIISEI